MILFARLRTQTNLSFLRKLSHDAFYTNAKRYLRFIVDSPPCPMYGEVETVIHVVCDCQYAKIVEAYHSSPSLDLFFPRGLGGLAYGEFE